MPARKLMFRMWIRGPEKGSRQYALAEGGSPGFPRLFEFDREGTAERLSELTGYKTSYIVKEFLKGMMLGREGRITLGHDLGIGIGGCKIIVERVQ